MDKLFVEVCGSENIVLPRKGDAGIDLLAASDPVKVRDHEGRIRFVEYGTGIKLAPSSEFLHGFVFPRSSISNYDLILCNHVPVIDSFYRGELKLRFRLLHDESNKIYEKGDKIAQLLFLIPANPKIIPVDSFLDCDTVRGDGGFGSTGK